MNQRATFTSLALALTAVACTRATSAPSDQTRSESDSASAEIGASEGGGCPFPAARDTTWPFAHGSGGESPSTYCPAGCAPVEAVQLDEAKACRRSVLLGCMPCANGCGGAPEGPSCTKYANDARLVSGAPGYAFANRSGWAACTPAEESAMTAAPLCTE